MYQVFSIEKGERCSGFCIYFIFWISFLFSHSDIDMGIKDRRGGGNVYSLIM